MIDELRIILDTIGDLGEYAVWAVIAFFLWKLLTLASVLFVVKFGIEKLYRLVYKKIETEENTADVIKELNIVTDGNGGRILKSLKEYNNRCKENIMWSGDVAKLVRAIDDLDSYSL